jgi:3-keto-L-gulonate-6-phosphate decarboxylase
LAFYLPSIASRHCLAASTGSIKPETIKEIVAEEPDLVIVGGGIANADDPVEAAKLLQFL